MSMSKADKVWNRACMAHGGPEPRHGDLALAAMLRFHSRAMSGGLLDAVEGVSATEVSDALAGFRYFGLDEAAAVLEWVVAQGSGVDADDIDAGRMLESQADERYGTVVPDDSVLTGAFERSYRARSEAFSPLE
jgi:hypothetical protein